MNQNNPYILSEENTEHQVCDPIAAYCKATRPQFKQLSLFDTPTVEVAPHDIRVVELFAGVGGFRIGLERASERFKTIWNNQWEPSTVRQDASIIYCKRFGPEGHSNRDIATVPTEEIPPHDLLVGGFPCQDYSVATTLKRSGGIEGKKGVLWWQIYRIISESRAQIARFTTWTRFCHYTGFPQRLGLYGRMACHQRGRIRHAPT